MKKIGLLLVLLTVASSALADEKIVKCKIENGKSIAYHGKCQIILEKGGSFSLLHAEKNKNLTPELISVSVSIIEDGLADVRGAIKGGINSEWGEAIRSKKDKGCWVGDEFKVCAWL